MDPVFRGIVDYAGLFPPASCTMTDAVRQYAEYRRGPDRAMLGRFVVAATRLEEFGAALTELGVVPPLTDPWPLSAVLGANVPQELDRIAAFTGAGHGAGTRVEAVEVKAATPGQVLALAGALPATLTRFFEVPNEGSYTELVDAIADAGALAKVRTGGITPDAFPTAEQLTRFLLAVTRRRVPFKATAGLHHPFRGSHPLTYAPDAPRYTMYGFVNLLLATAELLRGGDGETAQALLEEGDPGAFVRTGAGWRWQDRVYPAEELMAARTAGFTGFGSCSFREPVDELAAGVAA